MGRGSSGASRASSTSDMGGGGFHQFTGKESSYSSYEYDGGGAEAENFFKENSNSDELITSMDNYTKEAFRDWTRGHFMSGQQYEGWDGMSKYDQDLTRAYDRILDRATLDEGITVVRRSDAQLVMGAGKRTATLEELRAMEGRIITSKGSMSSGAAQEGLRIGSSSSRKPVEYRISVPGGEASRGAGMWVGDRRINGWGNEQHEFMFNRDTSYRVGKTTYDSRRGVHVVELLYVGLGEHDYGVGGHGRYRKRRGR